MSTLKAGDYVRQAGSGYPMILTIVRLLDSERAVCRWVGELVNGRLRSVFNQGENLPAPGRPAEMGRLNHARI